MNSLLWVYCLAHSAKLKESLTEKQFVEISWRPYKVRGNKEELFCFWWSILWPDWWRRNGLFTWSCFDEHFHVRFWREMGDEEHQIQTVMLKKWGNKLKHCPILSHRDIWNDQKQTAKSLDMHYISTKGNKASFDFNSQVAFTAFYSLICHVLNFAR